MPSDIADRNLMVDVSSYLARIGYTGSTAPTVEVLRAVHFAHLLTVPFENLDIELGREIVVDQNVTVGKVVELWRGGFCYELNGAFAALLRAMGFKVTLISARVAREKGGGEGPEFDHLTLRVDLGEPWLADVGFGESFLEPLRLEAATEQVDPAGRFRLVRRGERFELEKADTAGRWKRQYSFTLLPRRMEDFAAMCQYHQTSPDSSFTQNRLCTLATADGRITLSGMKLIVTRSGSREETMLSSDEETTTVLRERFGIRL